MVTNYEEKIKTIPEAYPDKVPLKHSIDLKDDVPVYENPRRIAYSQRDKVEDVIKDFLEKGFIRQSQNRLMVLPLYQY